MEVTNIRWPYVKVLLNLPGFRQNSEVLTSEEAVKKCGKWAYAVNVDWLNQQSDDVIFAIMHGFAPAL